MPRERTPRIDRRLLRETRAARRPLAASAVLGAGSAVLIVAQAVVLASVVDRAFLHGAALADVDGRLVALAGVVAARGMLAGAFELTGRLGALRVMSELRARLARSLLNSRPSGLPGERSGELAAATVGGVEALEAFFGRYLPQVVLSAIVPFAVLGWVLAHDLAAGIVLAIAVPLVPVFMVLVGLRSRDATRERQTALNLLGAHFLDVVRGLATLRAFGREHVQEATLATVGERLRVETMRTLHVAFLSAFVLELLAMLGTALVAATVGIQLAQGHVGLSVGLAVLLLAPELFIPLRAMGQQFHAASDGLAGAERIFAVLDRDEAAKADRGSTDAPDPADGDIVFDGVDFVYPGRPEPVLRGASLVVAPGERVALVAPSGAGKSTLAALLLRLAEPQAGAIRCAGIDLAGVDADAWRSRIAWAPQRGHLVAGTLAENVALGAPGADDAAVHQALRAAAGEELVDLLHTRIGDGGRTLSAGQAQRVVLARALARQAPLLVLDEPTAHLDDAAARRVADALFAPGGGPTMLVITHDEALAARADRAVRLVEGRLIDTPVGAAVAA